ncbi:hypothetical protein SERLA73DRAFT_192298 [Serpula lacrymans var. lacrymans S7.3]|uniref:Uncharacterized protein n=1 Tax=Serpula lacrymans var. lacrymans (strain S7.3) TaxID=936435 RepID=F8QJP2_SERL3|nr:hypothetical protein SERLA73DRAFT_192298 [Serpula lacrymans var. lacrymans S7.3]
MHPIKRHEVRVSRCVIRTIDYFTSEPDGRGPVSSIFILKTADDSFVSKCFPLGINGIGVHVIK